MTKDTLKLTDEPDPDMVYKLGEGTIAWLRARLEHETQGCETRIVRRSTAEEDDSEAETTSVIASGQLSVRESAGTLVVEGADGDDVFWQSFMPSSSLSSGASFQVTPGYSITIFTGKERYDFEFV